MLARDFAWQGRFPNIGWMSHYGQRYFRIMDRPCRSQRHLNRIFNIFVFSLLVSGCANTQDPQPAKTTGATTVESSETPIRRHPVGPYSIHILASGTEMELAGDMPIGTTRAVQDILDRNPKIHVIHLNSGGGNLKEGYELAKLIKQKRLTTYTATSCASACTLAFLAGSPRYLAKDAWMGFHSSSDLNSTAISKEGNTVFYRMYHDAGLPDDFINHALSTIPTEIWYPSHQELKSAHVVDDFVDSQKFSISGIAYWKTLAEVDGFLKEDDLYRAVSEHDAKAYEQIRELYLTGARLGYRTVDIDDNASGVIIDQYLPSYIKNASDKAVLQYQRAFVLKMQYLEKSDPEACAAVNFPDLGLPRSDYWHAMPQAIKQKINNALIDIVASSFEQRHASDTSGAIYNANSSYYRHLNGVSSDTVDAIDHPRRYHAAELCHAATEFYQHISDQPETEAAIIARYFFGSS